MKPGSGRESRDRIRSAVAYLESQGLGISLTVACPATSAHRSRRSSIASSAIEEHAKGLGLFKLVCIIFLSTAGTAAATPIDFYPDWA